MTVLLGYIDRCIASMNILLVTSHYAGIVISALTYSKYHIAGNFDGGTF